jgi:hypothetical protein
MSDVDVEDYVIVPAAVSPSSRTTHAVSFLWLSSEDPKAFITDKSWYNAIQSDLGGEWNLADLNACGVGIRIDKMISILWTWRKSTKSVNQQDILNNVAFLQTMLEAWCRASVLSRTDWWRVAPLMQVGKEVWVRFNDQNKMSYRELQRKALLSAWVIIEDYGWCSLTIDGVDRRIEFSVDELLQGIQDATEVLMWTVGYGGPYVDGGLRNFTIVG